MKRLFAVAFAFSGWLGAGDVSLVTLEALFAVAFAFSGWLGAGDVLLDKLEALFAVAFAISGWLGAGDVSLDTLEALFAVAFAFSGWLVVGDDAEKCEGLFVELSTCVDVVVVVAFGVALMFDARGDCMKLRQMQRQKTR